VALGRPGGLSAIVPLGLASGRQDIWVTPTDAPGAPRPFLNAAYNELTPAISPDGRWIAYVTDRSGRIEVYLRALEGEGAEIPVSVSGGTDPSWSSDGTEPF
jgi:Tol biopolymer transport system component